MNQLFQWFWRRKLRKRIEYQNKTNQKFRKQKNITPIFSTTIIMLFYFYCYFITISYVSNFRWHLFALAFVCIGYGFKSFINSRISPNFIHHHYYENYNINNTIHRDTNNAQYYNNNHHRSNWRNNHCLKLQQNQNNLKSFRFDSYNYYKYYYYYYYYYNYWKTWISFILKSLRIQFRMRRDSFRTLIPQVSKMKTFITIILISMTGTIGITSAATAPVHRKTVNATTTPASMPTVCGQCSSPPKNRTFSNATGNIPVFVAVASEAQNEASVTLSANYAGLMNMVLLSGDSNSLQWWIQVQNEAQIDTIYINTNKQSIRGFANIGDSSVPLPNVVVDPEMPAYPSAADSIEQYLSSTYNQSITSFAGCSKAATFQIADSKQCDAFQVNEHSVTSSGMICGSSGSQGTETSTMANPLISNNVISQPLEHTMLIISGYSSQGSVISVDVSDSLSDQSLILALATYFEGTTWRIKNSDNVPIEAVYVSSQINPNNVLFIDDQNDGSNRVPVERVDVPEIAASYQSGAFQVIDAFESAARINYTRLFVTQSLNEIHVYSQDDDCPLLISLSGTTLAIITIVLVPLLLCVCSFGCVGLAVFCGFYYYQRKRKHRRQLTLQEQYQGPRARRYDLSSPHEDQEGTVATRTGGAKPSEDNPYLSRHHVSSSNRNSRFRLSQYQEQEQEQEQRQQRQQIHNRPSLTTNGTSSSSLSSYGSINHRYNHFNNNNNNNNNNNSNNQHLPRPPSSLAERMYHYEQFQRRYFMNSNSNQNQNQNHSNNNNNNNNNNQYFYNNNGNTNNNLNGINESRGSNRYFLDAFDITDDEDDIDDINENDARSYHQLSQWQQRYHDPSTSKPSSTPFDIHLYQHGAEPQTQGGRGGDDDGEDGNDEADDVSDTDHDLSHPPEGYDGSIVLHQTPKYRDYSNPYL